MCIPIIVCYYYYYYYFFIFQLAFDVYITKSDVLFSRPRVLRDDVYGGNDRCPNFEFKQTFSVLCVTCKMALKRDYILYGRGS